MTDSSWNYLLVVDQLLRLECTWDKQGSQFWWGKLEAYEAVVSICHNYLTQSYSSIENAALSLWSALAMGVENRSALVGLLIDGPVVIGEMTFVLV